MENSLGLELFTRTTRTVRPTTAGQFLFQESIKLLGDVDRSVQRLKEDFAGARKEVRIGVSKSIGLAYLPGLFHASLRKSLPVGYRVTHQSSSEILSALEGNELDLGVLCPPARLPKTLVVTHRFSDSFTLITSADRKGDYKSLKWLGLQPWLLLEESTNTAQALDRWMSKLGLKVEPAMQLDSFDLIITLVSLGMGVSFVPKRALALYGQKKNIVRVPVSQSFERTLVVAMRKHRKQPDHQTEFVRNILF